jgi:formiminoglutamate deiminase
VPVTTAGRWHAEYAWLPTGPARDVLLEADAGGALVTVRPDSPRTDGASRLPGLTLPGLANAHSHAFHRALRGQAQAGHGSFWTWREQMYALAARLTPQTYFELARAVYAEMACAGITSVGEFHYLHHRPDGRRYADPNEMSSALAAAAAEAGVRLTLLDACYLAGGFDQPLTGPQRRFGDGDAERWAERVDALRPEGRFRVGAAVHSVRAVPADQIATVVEWATRRQAPLHFHLSEQRAENDACRGRHGMTPTELLARAGAVGTLSTAVHATHLTDADIDTLGAARCHVCMCPTTERDLADGIGPARELADHGAVLTMGSDSHAVIDLFEEARAVELNERLRSERRGHWRAAELLTAATSAGHASLGWPEVGMLVPGAAADLVTVSLESPRTAGARPDTLAETVVFAAAAADVRHVVVGGEPVVSDGKHHVLGDVGGALDRAVRAVLS